MNKQQEEEIAWQEHDQKITQRNEPATHKFNLCLETERLKK
jgi:hypothetical protein